MNKVLSFKDMCEVIADDWNKEQEEAKGRGAKDCIYFTGIDIWNFDLVGQFPALYIPLMYEASKTGNLIGLLLSDNTCAKMFFNELSKRKKFTH